MTLAGAFAVCMAPYELWRGVWPLNIATPFFGVIMLGGMAVGASFLHGGLFAPAVCLYFSPGHIEVRYDYLWGQSKESIRAENIEGFTIEEYENSDGPNCWYVRIRRRYGKSITSRPLATKEAADRQLAEFQKALSPLAS